MASEKLHEVLRAEPFQPFVLHMADGRQIEVRHPELMAISPSGRIAYVFEQGSRRDSGRHLENQRITGLEIRNAGATRRRRAG